MNIITAVTALQIGGPTTGEIDVTDAITEVGTGWSTLVLVNDGPINEPAPGSLTVNNLLVDATGPVSLTSASNEVTTLAVHLSGGSSFAFTDASAITVGKVLGVSGITSNGGDVILTSTESIMIGTGAGESINAASGSVELDGAGVSEGANSIVTAGGLLLEGDGTFALTNNNSVGTLAGNVTGGPINFTDIEGLTIGTVLTVNGLTDDPDITITINAWRPELYGAHQCRFGYGRVGCQRRHHHRGQYLRCGGRLAGRAQVIATFTTNLGTPASPLNTEVADFAADVGGSLNLANTGTLTITAIGSTSGVTAEDGSIVIATSLDLTVNQPINATDSVTLSGTHSITLNAVVNGDGVEVNGGATADTITVNTVGTSELDLTGNGGGDSYVLNLGTFLSPVFIDGSGLGTNQVIINGRPDTDTFTVTNDEVSDASARRSSTTRCSK